MLKKNEYVIYKEYVCKVRGIIKNLLNNDDYYDLETLNDHDLSLKVPLYKEDILKPILNYSDAYELINKIGTIKIINMRDDIDLDDEYRKLLLSGDREDLLKIFKTNYVLKNENIISDLTYYDIAEQRLVYELTVSLNESYQNIKKILVSKIEEEN